jgi:riboflavin kinase
VAKPATLAEGKGLGQLVFRGKIFSGSGTGKHFIELPWVKSQIEQKIGFTPYLGTLNLQLTKKEEEKRKLLEPAKGIQIKPQEGYFSGVLFRANVEGVEAAIVIPLKPIYPKDVLEVIAPLYLREKLGEKKDRVIVTVTV